MSSDKPSLLLLPPPPNPSTRASLSAAYLSPLRSVLFKLKLLSKTPTPELLTVAIACSILRGSSQKRKTIDWAAAQSLLAGVYTLVAVICAKEGISTEIDAEDGGVDVRVVLVDYEKGKTYYPNYHGGFEVNNTSVLDLPTFASKVRPWKTVFWPSSEEGYELRASFLKFAEGKQVFSQNQLVAVEGGIGLSTPTSQASQQTSVYDTVCLGGTFDHLHPGHKLLLHATALLLNIPEKGSGKTCTFIIGISGDELLVKKKHAEELQPWSARAQGVLSFLCTLLEYDTTATSPPTLSKPDELVATLRDGTVQVRCANLHDPFGPTITEENVDVIVVSGETRAGGEAINVKRREKGWRELDVYEIDVLDAKETEREQEGRKDDFAAKISSSAIREKRAEAKMKREDLNTIHT